MAKPIQAPPVLTGEAADQLIEHLKKAKPNPVNDERNRKALETHARIKRIDKAPE